MLRNPLDPPVYRHRHADDPANDIPPLIKALFEARLAWGLSKETVASRLGCHISTLAHMEAGRKEPSYKVLMRWADVLGYHIGLRAKPIEGGGNDL